MKELEIKVNGMSCNHCKTAVESELKEVKGVINAVVDLAAKNVTVSIEDENTPIESLYEAIEEAGYEPIKHS